jgi:hypothetical protein
MQRQMQKNSRWQKLKDFFRWGTPTEAEIKRKSLEKMLDRLDEVHTKNAQLKLLDEVCERIARDTRSVVLLEEKGAKPRFEREAWAQRIPSGLDLFARHIASAGDKQHNYIVNILQALHAKLNSTVEEDEALFMKLRDRLVAQLNTLIEQEGDPAVRKGLESLRAIQAAWHTPVNSTKKSEVGRLEESLKESLCKKIPESAEERLQWETQAASALAALSNISQDVLYLLQGT